MIAFIIVAFGVGFIGLIASLVVLYISEENRMKNFNEDCWVKPIGERAIPSEKVYKDYVIVKEGENFGTSRFPITKKKEPIVENTWYSSTSDSLMGAISEGYELENLYPSLN